MSSPPRRPNSRAGAVLGAALAVTVAAGCGGGGHAGASIASQTTTAPVTTAGGASTTDTTTAPSVKTSGAQPSQTTATPGGATSTPAQPTPPSPGGQLLRRFAGYGNGQLGTLVVHARSVLVWNARDPRIQIFTSNGFMLVNSRSPTGTVRLSRGTYRHVRVSSAAHWSVELRSAPS